MYILTSSTTELCKYEKCMSTAIKPCEIEYNYLLLSIILEQRAVQATAIFVIVYAHTHTRATWRSLFCLHSVDMAER